MNMITSFINEFIALWLEISPYLLLGMFISGLIHIFLGKDFIVRHLGGGGIWSVFKATIFGIPLPVCSCGVIPLASSLRREGAHKSSILAFLVATPTTGVDSILATFSLMGPLFMLFRPLGALLAGMAVGTFDFYFEKEDSAQVISIVDEPKKSISMREKLRGMFRYAFIVVPRDIGKWLIVGTLLGALIAVIVPQELVTEYLKSPLDYFGALVLGIPLYVCATGSIPIAVSLMAKGFSPGAALIFLIAGPATNAITLSFVKASLGNKSFWVYLLTIIIVSLFIGIGFNFLWGLLGNDIRLVTGMGKMLPLWFKSVSGVVLAVLVGLSEVKNKS